MSEPDRFNGLSSEVIYDGRPLKPESGSLVSNQWFLADIEPKAVRQMIIAWRLSTYNIILNFTQQVPRIFIIHTLLSP